MKLTTTYKDYLAKGGTMTFEDWYISGSPKKPLEEGVIHLFLGKAIKDMVFMLPAKSKKASFTAAQKKMQLIQKNITEKISEAIRDVDIEGVKVIVHYSQEQFPIHQMEVF